MTETGGNVDVRLTAHPVESFEMCGFGAVRYGSGALESLVRCLDENTILLFFERRLEEDDARRVDAHIAACNGCRQLLAAFAGAATHNAMVTETIAVAATEPTPSDASPSHLAHVARALQAYVARRVGEVLCGKWTIEGLIGLGGTAHVFAARHRNGRAVAIKMMRPEFAVEEALVERFLREGYVANTLEHPGAVAILDDDVTGDGVPFLVMERLRGQSLRHHLNAAGTVSLADAVDWTAKALDVLAVAHERGITHRDLKPENLFRTDEGAIKVLDFGIARLREHARGGETGSGTTMGTIGYMPPEQARGLVRAIDARSDVWAMGATFYNLVTGELVHKAETPNEALYLAMTKPASPARAALPTLPEPVARWLDRSLAFEPDDRFANARAMKDALGLCRATVSIKVSITEPVTKEVTEKLSEQTTESHALSSPPAASFSLPTPKHLRRSRGHVWPIAAAIVLVLSASYSIATSRRSHHATRAPSRPVELAAPPPSAIAESVKAEAPPTVQETPPASANPAQSVVVRAPANPPAVRSRPKPANSASAPVSSSSTASSSQSPSAVPAGTPVEPSATEAPRDPLGPRR